MNISDQPLLVLLEAAAVFGLVVSVWIIVVMAWAMRKRSQDDQIKQRLIPSEFQDSEGDTKVLRLWHEGGEATTTVTGSQSSRSMRQWAKAQHKASGLETPGGALMLYVVAVSALTFILVSLTLQNIPLAALVSVAVVVLSWYYLQHKISERDDLFEKQLVDALALAARSLRAGHPLHSAFGLVAKELPPPISDAFGEIWQQQALGISLEEAIRRVASENRSQDLKLVATATVIQLRTGGNMAEMMDSMAEVIRDRARLHRRARVLVSQTQLSKRILVMVPIAILVMLQVLNPEYLSPLITTNVGYGLLALSGFLLVAGMWIMNRIAILRY